MAELAPSRFKRWSDILWPLGGTVLGLIVVPLAIEQYPEFFHRNKWILPTSVIVVVICWLVPFFVHKHSQTTYRLIGSVPTVGNALRIIVVVGIIAGFWFGSLRLFRFHSDHLDSALRKEALKAVPQVLEAPTRGEPITPPQALSPTVPPINPKVKRPIQRPRGHNLSDTALKLAGNIRKLSLDWLAEQSKIDTASDVSDQQRKSMSKTWAIKVMAEYDSKYKSDARIIHEKLVAALPAGTDALAMKDDYENEINPGLLEIVASNLEHLAKLSLDPQPQAGAQINSLIENAGEVNRVEIEGAKVSSPEGGRATFINTLPGGKTSDIHGKDITISPQSNQPPVADGPPIKIGTGPGMNRFLIEDIHYCDDDESLVGVEEGGRLSNGTIRNNHPINCYWMAVLSDFATPQNKLKSKLDKFAEGSRKSWEKLPDEMRQANDLELSKLSEQLLNAPEDQLKTVIGGLMKTPPHFDVRYGWLAMQQK
jgi:hypothetical protein